MASGKKSSSKSSKVKPRQSVNPGAGSDIKLDIKPPTKEDLTSGSGTLQGVKVDEASGPCTAKVKSGETCECEKYSEDTSQRRDPNLPVTCRECGHGHSKHNGRRSPQGIASIIREVVGTKLGGDKILVPLKDAQRETNDGLRRKDKVSECTHR
jgi:hypothetical protein